MTNANVIYQHLLSKVLFEGDELETRNHPCYSNINALQASFSNVPLITLRKTAWKKALIEMEWFLSGERRCPDALLDWWSEQLNEYSEYTHGYAEQLRYYTSANEENYSNTDTFDQVAFVMKALKEHPNSRRIITTTWHPQEMATITSINENPMTPTTCHGSFTQYFVRNGKLTINTVQRSADMLLGVPHNWVQYWAWLVFLAYHCNLAPGKLNWTFGDAHIYNDESHLSCAQAIIAGSPLLLVSPQNFELKYEWSGDLDFAGLPAFKASDFKLEDYGYTPEPVTRIRPKLF